GESLGQQRCQGRRREHSAGARPRRRTRPHPLSVREGPERQERMQREVRRLLAAADRRWQAAREAGAKTSLLGTTRRVDGRLQVTYNHHPLYTFVKDTRKGQTNGEELDVFGAEWYAVSAAGAKVEKDTSSGGDPSPGGYGY